MPDIKVEDLVRSIREQARESAARHSDPSVSSPDSIARPLARLQTSVTITGRTRDQLPPVTTYRSGLLARIELGVKRLLKRITHWYTWEQVNFNSSVDNALSNTLAILQANEQRLADLQKELDAGLESRTHLESRLIEMEAHLARVESQFDSQLSDKLGEILIEHQKAIALVLEEQRVCFRQLAIEISEAGVITDRTKRSIQLRVDELAARLEEMGSTPRELHSRLLRLDTKASERPSES